MVPKGFVRYQVLVSLAEKPMSGSEIINEIQSKTDGRWKPSPGSIYPLLAWLQDNGHVKELPIDQAGMKRYELTGSGKALLEEQRKIFEEQRHKMDEHRKTLFGSGKGRFFGSPFMGPPWMLPLPKKAAEMRESMRKIVTALFEIAQNAGQKSTEHLVDESVKILNDTAEKLEEIARKLGGAKDE